MVEQITEHFQKEVSQTGSTAYPLSFTPNRTKAISAARELIESTGEDLSREGLLKTPQRFAKAMAHLTQGYELSLDEAIGAGIFKAESKGLILMKDIEFYSLCEHHLLPFWGKATIAYYPNEKILGLSKMPRIVEMFARRFQLQERLNQQVGKAIVETIQPRALLVRIEASHMCVMMRGVQKQHSVTLTEENWGLENLNSTEVNRLQESLRS
jgi:GTP cyclohydrolase IA